MFFSRAPSQSAVYLNPAAVRPSYLALRTRLIADKAKQADELLKDAHEVTSVPSGFAQFVIEKVKGKYPQFYANCERAWQALQKMRGSVKERAYVVRGWMEEMTEAYEHKYDDAQMEL